MRVSENFITLQYTAHITEEARESDFRDSFEPLVGAEDKLFSAYDLYRSRANTNFACLAIQPYSQGTQYLSIAVAALVFSKPQTWSFPRTKLLSALLAPLVTNFSPSEGRIPTAYRCWFFLFFVFAFAPLASKCV